MGKRKNNRHAAQQENRTEVFSKRMQKSVLLELEKKGIDSGHEVEKFLTKLSGMEKCPTCGNLLTDEPMDKVKAGEINILLIMLMEYGRLYQSSKIPPLFPPIQEGYSRTMGMYLHFLKKMNGQHCQLVEELKLKQYQDWLKAIFIHHNIDWTKIKDNLSFADRVQMLQELHTKAIQKI